MSKGEETRQRVYEFIKEYVEDIGYSPTVREICAGVGLKSPSSAFGHLKMLADEGRVEFTRGQKRCIKLPDRVQATMVPLLGRVTAGMPILAVEDMEGYIPVSREQARNRDLFALRVSGDSMKNAAILDGDIIVVEQRSDANNGDIVVAMLEDEATCKRFYRESGGYRLQPENDDYSPIFAKELSLVGRVVGLYRTLG